MRRCAQEEAPWLPDVGTLSLCRSPLVTIGLWSSITLAIVALRLSSGIRHAGRTADGSRIDVRVRRHARWARIIAWLGLLLGIGTLLPAAQISPGFP